MKITLRPNRNSRLFVKIRRPKKDSDKVRAEKDRLIAEFLEKHGVTKLTPCFAHFE